MCRSILLASIATELKSGAGKLCIFKSHCFHGYQVQWPCGVYFCYVIIFPALVFSERELTFTFAICYRPSVCLSSVVCL